MINTETLAQMELEVEQYCRDKGWYDKPVPFDQAVALLHEEAAEAGHAYRDWGLTDQTVFVRRSDRAVVEDLGAVDPADLLEKPEGVGSEFADILIRALDDSARYALNLPEQVNRHEGLFGINAEFMVNIRVLHKLIARIPDHPDDVDCFYTPAGALADVVRFTWQLSEYYGIDLVAEYGRKMAYNRTREYRHGGRRA